MKKILIILITFISLIYANDIKFYQPSFDCTNVIKDSVEYKICINEELSNLDKVLSILYEKLLRMVPKEELISEQKEFLKDRGLCDTNNCIKQSYENRIYILNNIYLLLNTNLSDYKSKKLSDTEKFINLQDEIKSHIFVNTLLEKIDIFYKNNYILFDNGFFFRDLHSNGIYYANTKTGKMQKIYTWTEPWIIIKNSNPINLIVRDSGGNHGLGYESIINLIINNEDNIEKNTIISVDYDMESGLCGRKELRLKKAGDIENFKYDEKNNNLIIDLKQQDCSNNKIEKKQLVYDFNSKDFIDLNIDSNKVEKNKTSEKEIENNTLNESKTENIKKIISSFQKNDMNYISNNLVNFPLKREYPIQSIKNQKEFKMRFNEVFDEELIKKIQDSKIEDWSQVGWRGIMLDDGLIWLDEYGQKIKAVNYESDFEKKLKQNLINKEKKYINSSLKDFIVPVYKIKTKNYLIRIDNLGDLKNDKSDSYYRYTSWKLPKDETLEPDLILLNGQKETDGSVGNHYFVFPNKEYIYKVYIFVIGETETPEVFLEVIKGDKTIFKENGTIQ